MINFTSENQEKYKAVIINRLDVFSQKFIYYSIPYLYRKTITN
jgi:hypothetical protein